MGSYIPEVCAFGTLNKSTGLTRLIIYHAPPLETLYPVWISYLNEIAPQSRTNAYKIDVKQ